MVDIFAGAIIFAIWSVVLFYGKAIGFSMLLFVVPITFYIIHILEKHHDNLNKNAKILIIPITLLSSTYLIYNNKFFGVLNQLVIPTLLVLMILGLYKEKIEIKFNLIGKMLKVVFKPFEYIGEAFKKSRKIFKEKPKNEMDLQKSKNIKRGLKALAITIPVVLVVLWLLSSADQIFGNIFGNILDRVSNLIRGIQVSNVIETTIISLFAFIYFLGFFYYIALKYKNSEIKESTKKIDSFTIKMVLGALNVIYLVFCFIQIKSLFMKNVGINYAEYARQGFFQLMLVSIINLVTVLIAKNRETQEEIKSKYIKIMCLLMAIFTFIILISAAYRMYLYESAYGYTLLRLLVYCVLLTEGVLLLPTVLYIIDKNINLSITYFSIVITIYTCMNFANFDNLIAKRNVDRYIETGKIDMVYLVMNTGTDSTKQIIRIIDAEEKEKGTKVQAKSYLKNMYDYLNEQETDFRDFNFSKLNAKNLLNDRINDLQREDIIRKFYTTNEMIDIDDNMAIIAD